jgi:hypothetical protein
MSDDKKKIGNRTTSFATSLANTTSRSQKPEGFSSFTATTVKRWRRPSALWQYNPSVGEGAPTVPAPSPRGVFLPALPTWQPTDLVSTVH